MVGDLNTPLSIMDRASRQKINKKTEDLNNTRDQMDLTDNTWNYPPKDRLNILLTCTWNKRSPKLAEKGK